MLFLLAIQCSEICYGLFLLFRIISLFAYFHVHGCFRKLIVPDIWKSDGHSTVHAVFILFILFDSVQFILLVYSSLLKYFDILVGFEWH